MLPCDLCRNFASDWKGGGESTACRGCARDFAMSVRDTTPDDHESLICFATDIWLYSKVSVQPHVK